MGDPPFDPARLGVEALRLAIALLLALPVGWERERAARSAGMRTFPLVAVAACGYVLVGLQVLGRDAEAQARLLQGLMTGMGFVGGGAILKVKDTVHGTATAASLWVTGALGAAVGYGRYDTALMLSLITLGVLRLLGRAEMHVRSASGQPPRPDD